jgi:hypothetical protein
MNPKILFTFAQTIRLLPSFILGIETLFGKATGETKKQAVVQLAQASLAGAAVGYEVTGNDGTAQAIAGFVPVVSQTVDSIVADFNATGVFTHTATQAQSATA